MRRLNCFLLIAFFACASFTGDLSERVAKTYTSQLGVREATGNNDGKDVEKYLKAVKLGKGYAWCAAFVAWTYDQHNIEHVRSAWTPAWFPTAKLIFKGSSTIRESTHGRTPARADVFGIYFPAKKRIAHVGFIDEFHQDRGYAVTVEGNTNEAGSREGDGVYKKRRLIKQIYAVSRWF